MAKLSKAQQEVIDNAKMAIDKARALDYPEWLKATEHFFASGTEYAEKCFKEAVEREYLKEYWEKERKGIVLTHCNSKTIKKLEELGLIKIHYDSNGDDWGIDDIELLNY